MNKEKKNSDGLRTLLASMDKRSLIISGCAALLVVYLIAAVIAAAGKRGKNKEASESFNTVTAGSYRENVPQPAENADGAGNLTSSAADGAGEESAESGTALAASSGERTLTLTAVGDCTFGTDENFNYSTSFNAYYDEYGYQYFMKNVKDFLSEDDLTIANLETTFTESTDRNDKTYAFKAPPEYAQILTDGSVEACNIANNHSNDYGSQSYTDTVENIQAQDITVFGKQFIYLRNRFS